MTTIDTPHARRAPLRALIIAALGIQACQADTAPTPAGSELDTVTVFGSRVKARTVFDSAVPIDVFSAQDVQQALASGELGQALQALSPSVNMPRASASGTSDSIRTIQLRGLAPDEVLVLVNGKRRHTNSVMDIEGLFPGTVAVDLNAIPQEAIDHIEVLRDGAGALYGSDAIAGVVNIVLKSGAHGGAADAAYGENHTHFAPTQQTITDGRNRTVDFDYGLPVAETGSLHFGADYQKRGATNRAGRTDSSFASYFNTPADQALNNEVVFRSGDPDLTNKSLFYNIDLPLSGGADVYSFATLNWRNTKGAAFFRYPGDPTNNESVYPSGYLPVSTGASHDVGFVAGARGDASGWKWDLSAREGYNTFSYGLENSLNASLGADSPTSFHVADFTYEERAVNFDLARPLALDGLHSPLNISAGAEYMHQAYHTTPGDPASYAQGDPTLPPGSQGDNGLRPQDAVHLTRHVISVYADVDDEITSRLLIGAAGRYSNYSDYGSSTTGKFSVRYNLTEDFLWRGAVSNSFRAPSLAQTGLRLTTLNLNSNGTGLQNTAFLPPTDPLAQANGGVDLKPEKSVNFTTGLAWRAGSGTEATVDLYQIKITDRITPTGQFPVAIAPPQDPALSAVSFLTNGLDTTTRGLDAVVSHHERLSGGELKVSVAFNRNYNHQDGLRGALASQGINAPVVIPLLYGSPSTKLIANLDWSTERWGAYVKPIRYGNLYAFTYDSNQPTFDGANAQRYGAAWTADAEIHYNPTAQSTVAIGGSNIFNRYPDQTTPGGTYGGSFPYNFINPIGLNGAYYYVRLSVKLGN